MAWIKSSLRRAFYLGAHGPSLPNYSAVLLVSVPAYCIEIGRLKENLVCGMEFGCSVAGDGAVPLYGLIQNAEIVEASRRNPPSFNNLIESAFIRGRPAALFVETFSGTPFRI